MKPAPKKETARIQIPNLSKDLPKATVRLQNTQPLSASPAASIRPATSLAVADSDESEKSVLLLSIGALVFALIAFVIQLWIYL